VQAVEYAGLTGDPDRTQIEERAAAQVFNERDIPAAGKFDQFFQ